MLKSVCTQSLCHYEYSILCKLNIYHQYFILLSSYFIFKYITRRGMKDVRRSHNILYLSTFVHNLPPLFFSAPILRPALHLLKLESN